MNDSLIVNPAESPQNVNVIQNLEQISSVHNSLSSLEGTNFEKVLSGVQRNGKMSVVRRFFCLFVLFDLLLIGLTWLICLMLMGSSNIIQILKMQVLHYNIKISLFDIVLAACVRFTILSLSYGLLQLNTTFFVALTTLSTCVFLIFKVIYYSWSTVSQPIFQVILVLISFIIAWTEAWFLDFRVLPEELFALTYTHTTRRFSEPLNYNIRNPLLQQFLRSVQEVETTESNRNFYSPQQSVMGSENDSDDLESSVHSTAKTDHEFVRLGKNIVEVAYNIFNDSSWILQKKSLEGDCIFSTEEKHFGKCFLLRTVVNIQPQDLFRELFTRVDKFTSWNKTVISSKRIQTVDKNSDVIYQISAPGAGGVISSRDFVILRRWEVKENTIILAGTSVPHPEVPPCNEYIRGENGACCWIMAPNSRNQNDCLFHFLLNTNLKGWIPKKVVENALVSVLLEYSKSLKEYCSTYKG